MKRPRCWRRRTAMRKNARRWSRVLYTRVLPRMVQAALARELDAVMKREIDRVLWGTTGAVRPTGILNCRCALKENYG